MSKKFGLGKGLGALIPEEDNKEKLNNGALTIPLNMIKNNADQPRKHFDNERIAELAESIKHHGIIQPLIVTKEDGKYTLVAGERRWRAAKMIGLKDVPAIVMNLTDKQILEISLIENIQRQDLNPIEEAVAYKKLLTDFDLTQEELSKRIGKSRVAITNTIRLINLDSRVQQYLIDSVITEGHGRALLGIEDKDVQCIIAQRVIDERLSVRELEKLIKSLEKKQTVTTTRVLFSQADVNPYYKDLQNRLQDYFGTKVKLNMNPTNDKGKLEIEYYSEEDLQRILEIIKID